MREVWEVWDVMASAAVGPPPFPPLSRPISSQESLWKQRSLPFGHLPPLLALATDGAFITLKEGVDGLCHISAIQEGGVSKVGDVLTIGQEVQVRIVQFEKSKRRIGLSMKPWVEGEQGGRAPRRSREDSSFQNDDADFKLSEEELAELEVADDESDFTTGFEAAFARASLVSQLKSEKKRYKSQIL